MNSRYTAYQSDNLSSGKFTDLISHKLDASKHSSRESENAKLFISKIKQEKKQRQERIKELKKIEQEHCMIKIQEEEDLKIKTEEERKQLLK